MKVLTPRPLMVFVVCTPCVVYTAPILPPLVLFSFLFFILLWLWWQCLTPHGVLPAWPTLTSSHSLSFSFPSVNESLWIKWHTRCYWRARKEVSKWNVSLFFLFSVHPWHLGNQMSPAKLSDQTNQILKSSIKATLFYSHKWNVYNCI